VAIVRRSERGRPSTKKLSRRREEDDEDDIELPFEYEEPGGEFDDFSVLLHGEKKIGKTSLALQTDDPDDKVLLIQFDPPQTAYRRMEVVCPNFARFRKVLKKLERLAKKGPGKFPYRRVVIDRADTWYRYGLMYACEKLGIDDPGDLGYGKGWNAVRKEFTNAADRFLRLPCGKWFLCHSEWADVENRHGDEIRRLVPNLPGQPEEILNGKVDAWFAYAYEGRRRVIIVQGDERVGAGHRINGHFLTPEDEPVRVIPAGRSEKEAFKNLLAAFNNEQETVEPVSKKRKRLKAG